MRAALDNSYGRSAYAGRPPYTDRRLMRRALWGFGVSVDSRLDEFNDFWARRARKSATSGCSDCSVSLGVAMTALASSRFLPTGRRTRYGGTRPRSVSRQLSSKLTLGVQCERQGGRCIA